MSTHPDRLSFQHRAALTAAARERASELHHAAEAAVWAALARGLVRLSARARRAAAAWAPANPPRSRSS
jgi:hypothetical protein